MATSFHVVRSVKGGSGKTAFALHYVISLVKDKHKVLYIDADVHASETRNMLFENAFSKRSSGDTKLVYYCFARNSDPNWSEKEAERHSLNTYIHPYKGYYSKLNNIFLDATIEQCNTESSETPDDKETVVDGVDERGYETAIKYGDIGMIFADPSEKGRRVFGSLFQSAGQSAVGVGAYTAKIKELLNYILDCKDYTDVIVDMPPGSDTFSEHLMDCLIDFITKKNKDQEKSDDKNPLCIYYIATMDRAHIRTSIDAAIDHLHLMRAISPLKIYFVMNYGLLETDSLDYNRNTIIKRIKDAYKTNDKGLSQYELNRLNYMVFNRDTEYLKSATKEGGVFFTDDSDTPPDTTPKDSKNIMEV